MLSTRHLVCLLLPSLPPLPPSFLLPVAIVLSFFCLPFFCFAFYMVTYHYYLLLVNATTNENVKALFPLRNPFLFHRHQYSLSRFFSLLFTKTLLQLQHTIYMPTLSSHQTPLKDKLKESQIYIHSHLYN